MVRTKDLTSPAAVERLRRLAGTMPSASLARYLGVTHGSLRTAACKHRISLRIRLDAKDAIVLRLSKAAVRTLEKRAARHGIDVDTLASRLLEAAVNRSSTLHEGHRGDGQKWSGG
jgi:hypothetical protein